MSKKAPSLGSLINAYLFYSYSIDISPTKTLIFMNIFIRGQMYVFPQVILQTHLIMDMTGCDNMTSFQRLPVDIQNECIGKLKKSGASIRQISRLTGITYYAIQKVNHRTVP